MPFSRWGAQPFAIHPLPYPAAHVEQLIRRIESGSTTANHRKHPIYIAWKWQGKPRSDPTLTRAQIAVKEGLSRARVTQVMSLLELPADILYFIASLTNPKEIRFFSERRLRRILTIEEPSLQLRAWASSSVNSRAQSCFEPIRAISAIQIPHILAAKSPSLHNLSHLCHGSLRRVQQFSK